MNNLSYATALAITITAGFLAQPAYSETPKEVLVSLQKEAASSGGFEGFSAVRGQSFFKQTHGNEWSCATCHTDNPASPGKHAKTGKVIEPFAPSANTERFTNPKKVEKWFKRNCNDVLDRVCTAQEKGDVLTYLLSVK